MQFEFTMGPSSRRPRPSAPVRRLLVLADLYGDQAAAAPPLLDRPITKVDLDNLDAVLARVAPAVQLAAHAGGERVEIRSYDHFHPDHLVDTLAVFGRLRGLRTRLNHPSTFAAAVAELQGDAGSVTGASTQASPEATGAGDIDRLLGRRTDPTSSASVSEPASAPLTAQDAVASLIRQAVAPHVVPAPSPQVPQMLAAIDAAMTDLLRAVLHDPGFQAVESTWRAVQWLVTTLELDETLELHLLHVTRTELGTEARPDAALWRRLVEREARVDDGFNASALIVGFSFGPGADDVSVIEALGGLGEALQAPVVAGASAACLGITSIAAQPDPRDWLPLAADSAARWTALRTHPAAQHIGLVAPRFLLRLPYGQKTDPIASFRFEEQPPTPRHETFLWGCGAYAAAVVVSRVLAPEADTDGAGTLEGLPAFVYTTDDERAMQAPAEVAPTETAVIAIQSRGIMPLVSYKGRDDIRLVALHTVASPPTHLLG